MQQPAVVEIEAPFIEIVGTPPGNLRRAIFPICQNQPSLPADLRLVAPHYEVVEKQQVLFEV